MNEKNNLRVLKTQKSIKKAFFKLMKEKGFEHVTVKDIVNYAQINRGTFYLHYTDKYALLETVKQELLDSLLDVIKKTPYRQLQSSEIDWDEFNNSFKQFAQFVSEHGEVFALLQSENGDPSFSKKFYEMTEAVWQKHHITSQLSIPKNYALTGLISLTSSLMLEWVNTGFKETPDEFVQILAKIVRGIPSNIMK
ncbi:MAG: TetR/AcrR family transcriptional regulator [Enterococcus sp.]